VRSGRRGAPLLGLRLTRRAATARVCMLPGRQQGAEIQQSPLELLQYSFSFRELRLTAVGLSHTGRRARSSSRNAVATH
jgi:hypothetical protein